MLLPKRTIVVLSFLIIVYNYNYCSAGPDTSDEIIEILFLGSSYFNLNNLPVLFENLAVASGKEVNIDQYIINGLYLEDHAKSSYTESKIKERDWDYVVLQGVGSVTAYPETYTDHPVYPALETLQNKIISNCESTIMVFCLPWAYEDGMTWLAGWTDTYEDMQIKIYENTLKYAYEIGFVVAPVGWAWYRVLEEKNYPLHYLHMSDWNHPSLKGSYLMACVIYSTLFQASSVDIPYYGGLTVEDAIYFQDIASNIVLGNPELWNITATNIKMTEPSSPSAFHLFQNHPNPFYQSTIINYKIRENSFVEISVFDLLGKIHNILVWENRIPGDYCVRFDGSNLNGGIYYCCLKAGNQTQMKKMLLIK